MEWGMKINPNPIQTTARLLDSPKVVLKDSKRKVDSPFPPRDGTWNMASKHVCRPGRPVANWSVADLSSPTLRPS